MWDNRFFKDDRKNVKDFQDVLDNYKGWKRVPRATQKEQKALGWMTKTKLGIAPIIKTKMGKLKNVITGRFTSEKKEYTEIMGLEYRPQKPPKKIDYYKLSSHRVYGTKQKYDIAYIDEPLKNPQTGRKEYWGMNYQSAKRLGIEWYWGENTILVARNQKADEFRGTVRHEVIESNYYKVNPKVSYQTAHRATSQLERSKKTKYE